MSTHQDDEAQRGQFWCLVRQDRNLSRFQPTLGEPFFSDAPDGGRADGERESDVAKRIATNIPILMMIRQNGLEEQGWHGTPFYWPVIYAPQNVRVSIFAHETTP